MLEPDGAHPRSGLQCAHPNFAPRLLKGCCKGLESHRRKLEAEGQDQGEMRGHLADDDLDKNAGRRAQLRNATLYAGMSTTVSVRACE